MSDTPAAGFIYVIREGDLFKIGRSRFPSRRLPQVADPTRSCVAVRIPSSNPPMAEAALHRHFAASCVGGEWFRLAEADLALLGSLERLDGPADFPAAMAGCTSTAPVPVAADILEMLQELAFYGPRTKGKRVRVCHLVAAYLRPVVEREHARLKARLAAERRHEAGQA